MLRQFLINENQINVIDEFLMEEESTKEHMMEEFDISKSDVDEIFQALLELEMIEHTKNNTYKANWESPILHKLNDLGCVLCEHVISRSYENNDYEHVNQLYIGELHEDYNDKEDPSKLFDSIITKVHELGGNVDDILDLTNDKMEFKEEDIDDLKEMLACLSILENLKERNNI